MLRDFGISANPCIIAESESAVIAATGVLDYPLALKTAMPGIEHKSDQAGVVLNIGNERDLLAAYLDIKYPSGSVGTPLAEVLGGSD